MCQWHELLVSPELTCCACGGAATIRKMCNARVHHIQSLNVDAGDASPSGPMQHWWSAPMPRTGHTSSCNTECSLALPCSRRQKGRRQHCLIAHAVMTTHNDEMVPPCGRHWPDLVAGLQLQWVAEDLCVQCSASQVDFTAELSSKLQSTHM